MRVLLRGLQQRVCEGLWGQRFGGHEQRVLEFVAEFNLLVLQLF